MAAYRPGVCNIGCDERRRRFYSGIAMLILAVGYTAWLLATDQSSVYLAGTFLLLLGGLLGYFQGRTQFCVAFGALARYDLSGSGGEGGTISEADRRRKDRRRALELFASAAGMAVAGTLSVYVADGILLA